MTCRRIVSFLDPYGDNSASKRGAEGCQEERLAAKIEALRSRKERCGTTWVHLRCPDYDNLRVHPGATPQHYVKHRCMSKLCSDAGCSKARVRRVRRTYVPPVQRFRYARFVTLTTGEHYLDVVPKQAVRSLNESFKLLQQKLRRFEYTDFAGQKQKRDISMRHYLKVLEFGQFVDYIDCMGEYRAVYSPHLHVVYDGLFIPYDFLQKAWESITGARIVRIERAGDVGDVSRYLTDYATKSTNLSEIEPRDYVLNCEKMRFFSSLGLDFSCPECGKRMYNGKRGRRCRCRSRVPNYLICPCCQSRFMFVSEGLLPSDWNPLDRYTGAYFADNYLSTPSPT